MENKKVHPMIPELAEQYHRGKIGRRQFLRLTTLLGLSVSAAAALGGFSLPGRALAAAPRRGGELKISGLVGKLTHPAQFSWPEPANIARLVAQYLTLTGKDNITRPYLLENWQVSQDLKTWTLNLKKGIKFNNGDEFTSQDVAFTMGQWLDPAVKSSFLGLMGGYLDKSGIEISGQYQVTLHLKRGEIAVPEHLNHYPGLIMNHKTFDGEFLKNPVGTGPYTLEDYQEGNYCILKARKDYWAKGADGKPLPYLDGIRFIDLGKDMAPRIAALKSGEVDMVDQGSITGPQVAMAIKGDKRFTAHIFNSALTKILRIRSDVKPWSDNRVRLALKLCQNREKIKALAYQNTGLIGQDCHVYENHPEYCKVDTPAFDPARAKALLAEAGYPKGLKAELFVGSMFPDAIRFAEILKSDAAAAGFDLVVTPTAKYFEKWTEYPLGITPWGHRPLGTMVLNLAYTADDKGNPVPWNETHWVDKEFSELLNQANRTIDVNARRKIFCKLEKIQQERGSVGVVQFESAWLCATAKLKNVNTPIPYLNIDEVWLEG